MKARHRAREVALQILYQYDVKQSTIANSANAANAMALDLNFHFDHFQVPEGLREFSAELVSGTLRDIPQLDALLEKHAANWKITRMSLIDRNLLRMATYELLHFPNIPESVTINEAIELAKQFGTAETPAFINGILDAIKQEKSTQS
jgi:transcription antitermination protein NusB